MIGEMRLHRPESVDEAAGLLESLGDEAAVYAGGTELLLVLKFGMAQYGHLVDVKRVGLHGISVDDDTSMVRIGATATHREVERSELVAARHPILAEVARNIANVRVRASGTVGGNLCFAEPHSDLAAVMLMLGAQVNIAASSGSRVEGMDAFIEDAFTTSLQPGELVTSVSVPLPPAGAGIAYGKLGVLERPAVAVGCVVVPDAAGERIARATIVLGCVEPTPVPAAAAAASLVGADAGLQRRAALAAQAGRLAPAACDPIDDIHGSAPYKRHLVEVLTRRVVRGAMDRIGGTSDGRG
jgi:aerobic carbon-monoxide dehydrogenase medium subunit